MIFEPEIRHRNCLLLALTYILDDERYDGGSWRLVHSIMRLSCSQLFLTMHRLADFEAYRAELLRRWPDIKLPDAE
jgi:hypothetical protein